jgi:spore coat polysaccharide biosynthesis protein SpsF
VSNSCDTIVVATTNLPEDDVVAAEAARLGVDSFRGDSSDVLSRYEAVVDEYGPDQIVRITSDCPLLDPAVVRSCVEQFDGGIDLVTTGPPDTLPRGLDVEVASSDAIHRLAREATGIHREHVTSWAYAHPDRYDTRVLAFEPDDSDLRVTLDTMDDARCIRAIVGSFGDRPLGRDELVRFLRARPDVVALNSTVRQKTIGER